MMILCLTYILEIFFEQVFQAIEVEIIIPFSSPLIGYITKSMSVLSEEFVSNRVAQCPNKEGKRVPVGCVT
jgi:hypothetical protein